MFKRKLFLVLSLMLAWGVSPSANAGTMILDSFVDQTPATINLPATNLLMATVNTNTTQGGNDASATTVSIGGSVVAADIAEVCVDYNTTVVTCQTSPGSLSNISLSLGGNEKGGNPFDYRITLNPSAAGKTIQLTVESISNTNLTDNIPLPASTAIRSIGGATVAPTVTTPTFTGVTDTTATLGGNVTADGGATVTDRGIVWNTTSPAETGGTTVLMGSGTGTFAQLVSVLPQGTLIYFKAYATNSVDTSYSTESSFTTLALAPTVTTPTFTAVTDTTATLGGNVTADGGATVTSRGVEWGTDIGGLYPNSVSAAAGGTGIFTVPVTGLPESTTIYFRAWATNLAGTSVSVENSFPTDATPVAPTVTTPTFAAVTDDTATLGGTMTAEGSPAVTDCGVEWGTSTGSYGTSESFGVCTVDVPFTVAVTGLPAGTTIYFRAWATNGATRNSTEASFATLAGLPTVATRPVENITATTADLGGDVTSNGGAAVTDHGIVWSTAPEPIGGTVVSIGTGSGPFISTIGDDEAALPTDTLVYFRAYATNIAGTAYSAIQSFTPTAAAGTEPTVQASNLAFPTVAGRSIRMTWTRGDGDGVIVVMRLTATGITAPQDGADYTGDPDFSAPPPELPTGSQNFVVYKGPGTSVLITGLTMTTSYSVAVYEYKGTGVSTDYLLTTPAEWSDTTTDYAVHNYDNRVDCDDCHNHGAFGARDTELKAVCETCHNPVGLASNKLEFDNHVTPTKNPGIDFVDCGMCHEMHNLSATNTTESFNDVTSVTQHNKSFLRANVDKYVSTASPPAYLHTDTPVRVDPHPDAPQAADNPDRAVEGGNDTTATGYCQVCHSLTNYHRSSNTAGAEQCHDGAGDTSCGPAEVHCGACHEHNNNFSGAGGSCTGCHASPQGDIPRPIITTQFDRLSTHIPGGSAVVTQDDCLVCHDQSTHTTQTVRMLDADDGVTIYSQSTPGASTLLTGQGEAYEQACLSCHDSNGASRLPAYADTSDGQTDMSPFTGVFYDPPPADPVVRFPEIDATNWANASHNRPVATSGSSPVTCAGNGANGCHASGHGSESNSLLASWDGVSDPNLGTPASSAPVSPIDFCYNCHDANGPSSIDVKAQFNTATNYQATASSGNRVNQRHDITSADQIYSGGAVSCRDCHSPHEDNATNPVFTDLHTGTDLVPYSVGSSYTGDSPSFAYDSGGNNDPMDPVGISSPAYTEPDYVQFCLACHDGTAPPGVTLPGAMENIALRYDGANQHGSGDGAGTAKGYLKYPWNSQGATTHPGAYAAINCTTCHGAHGSVNIFNLRESITVAGVQMRVGGWGDGTDSIGNPRGPYNCTITTPTVDPDSCSTTYILPPMDAGGKNIDESGSQTNRFWGAWCSFCHQMQSHSQSEEDQCNQGHLHGGGNF